MNKTRWISIAGIILMIVSIFLVSKSTWYQENINWRITGWRADIKYKFNPPEKEIFIPAEKAPTSPTTPTQTQTSTPEPSIELETTPIPSSPTTTSLPTVTPTPLPEKVILPGFKHEYQKWNNCGPANLSMGLSFWGWEGDQRDTASFLKPSQADKNVMPYEMIAFVDENTNLKALVRIGGDIPLIKAFLAENIPVILEKGFEGPGFSDWMGHYLVISGYDDSRQRFITQDSYIGPDYPLPYDQVETQWRAFNFTYLLIFPEEKEDSVMRILGANTDESFNYRNSAQKASEEIYILEGRDKFFAWYNRGTNLVYLRDYAGAAEAYDNAFEVYPDIPEERRPWRMLWYQTGPYFAYFYNGRYYDVINLATTTLTIMEQPILEESFYWRGMAKKALGDVDGAAQDFRESLKLHPDFEPALYQLQLIEGQ